MILKLEQSQENVLGFEVTDRVTEGEYQRVIHEVHAAIEQHGSVRLLVLIPDMVSSELGTIDDRLRFLKEHRHDIERYAVVGDARLVEWLAKFADVTTGINVRHFNLDEEDRAWEWLRS